MKRSFVLILGLAACSPSPTDQPDTCPPQSIDPPLAEVEINAVLDMTSTAGDLKISLFHPISVGDNRGWVALEPTQHLDVFPQDVHGDPVLDAPIALDVQSDGCNPTSYTASGLATDLFVTLHADDGFDFAQRLDVAPITATAPADPVQLGVPFTIALSRDIPAISGTSVVEEWSVELRGACVNVDPALGYARAIDPNANGSQGTSSHDGLLEIEIPASAITLPAGGCDVTATLVDGVIWQTQGTFLGRYHTDFTVRIGG
ncbi:MAG: hypothetical protein HOV81_10540 [Kofleriaceae bacterium]|nr:hypothetical protein [Kofleriaceae bacterium]